MEPLLPDQWGLWALMVLWTSAALLLWLPASYLRQLQSFTPLWSRVGRSSHCWLMWERMCCCRTAGKIISSQLIFNSIIHTALLHCKWSLIAIQLSKAICSLTKTMQTLIVFLCCSAIRFQPIHPSKKKYIYNVF